ncbi:MAG: hypothetical protein LBG72_04270, partial [Spirochaetaceae bacterium]|nr:hypothetical protein [Spirochaetaceae bacterium]
PRGRAGGGPPPPPTTPDPNAVNILTLSVYYKGDDLSKSLPLSPPFDAKDTQTKNYTLVIEDETKEALSVDAEGAGSATIKLKYKSGGNEKYLYPNGETSTPIRTVTVGNIPLPTDDYDTEIVLECGNGSWNGEPSKTITIKVMTPTPTLESLSVRYTSEKSDDSKELIKYTKGQTDYTLTAKQTDNKVTIKPVPVEGQEIKVMLKSSKPGEAEAELPAVDGAYDAEPGEAGGYNKSVNIEVKYSGKEKKNVYSVTLVPPTSSNPVGYTLTDLKVSYAPASADSGNLLVGNKAFDSSIRKYTLSPNTVDGPFTDVNFTAASEPNSKITVTYTDIAGMNYTGEGTTSVSGHASIPTLEGESRTLKFKVARDDGQNAEWSVTINAPSDVQTWSGTITYAGSENYSVQGLVVKDANRNFQAGILTPGSNAKQADFQIEAPDAFTPKTFFVQLLDNQGRAMQTVPLEPSVGAAINPININIPDKSKLTYIVSSANNFYTLFNDSANKEVSYSLFNDIDLNDYTVNGVKAPWSGPAGYQGHFYGNGYTIKNLEITSNSTFVGLFRNLGAGAVLEDFHLVVTSASNVTVSNNLFFGGVLGTAETTGTTVIRKVKVTGDLNINQVTTSGWLLVGGIVAEVRASQITIENCLSELNININSPVLNNTNIREFIGIGSFVGKLGNGPGSTTTIKNCAATGNVSITFNGNKPIFAGGFVGIIHRGTSAIIENCYATGTVTAINPAPLIDAKYNVSGAHGTFAAGGFVGFIHPANVQAPVIKNCAALGAKAVAVHANAAIDPAEYGAGRFCGLDKRTSVFTNNFARRDMRTGDTLDGTANTSNGDANTKEGAAKDFDDFKQLATWTNPPSSGGLGWSADIWDFSTVPTQGSPVLK